MSDKLIERMNGFLERGTIRKGHIFEILREIERLRAELAEKEACIEDLCTKEKNYLADLRVVRKELAAIKDAELPLKTTPAIREALRTGSRKDYPSDELCEVRWAAIRAAMAKEKQS